MASHTSQWFKALFLLLLFAIVSHSQHSSRVQIVPLESHPISLNNRHTQGLAAVQRFRQILQIDENHHRLHEVDRFQQSLPTPPMSHQNQALRPKITRIPEQSQVPSSGISPQTNIHTHTLSDTLRSPQTAVIKLNTQTLTLNRTTHIPHVSTPEIHKNIPGNQNSQTFQKTPGQSLPFREQTVPTSQQTTDQKLINQEFFQYPSDTLRIPEAPRVPQIPAHLPLDLTNRLQEFPSLVDSLDQANIPVSTHSFFEPTVEVQAEELTDEEWQQYLTSEWGSDGVVPTLLDTPPNYVVNVVYGGHLCLHLGNTITPAQARHKPKSVVFSGEENRQYTVMLVDIDHPTGIYINWLLVNVPLNQLHKGMEIIQYEPPRPGQGTGVHRMVFMVYLQQNFIPPTSPSLSSTKICENFNREGTDLNRLTQDLGLKGPTSANYFRTEWDITVEHTCGST